MTTHNAAAAASTTPRVRLAVMGWFGLIVFALSDVVGQGTTDLAFMAGVACIAGVLALVVRMSPGRPALVVSAVLGALVALAQGAYVLMDVAAGDVVNTAIDSIGLLAGVEIALGSITALATLRATRSNARPQ